jgi:hypothetical protein
MAFTLTDYVIRRVCQINHFQTPAQGMIFFGLRGCLPTNPDDQEFRTEHVVEVVAYDHIHPRCTLGQWKPEDGSLALFAGSTVPHRKYVKSSLEKDGKGTNQMMSGYYTDYRKGKHKAGTSKAHDAFRQTEGHPIRRTADDFDYDNDDRVEFMNAYDNMHSGWSMGVTDNSFASAGCQVVVGYPCCDYLNNEPDLGPWKTFKKNAYDIEQQSFPYILLNGVDVQKIAVAGSQKMSPRLRFGSQGQLVSKVQTELQARGFYEGSIDPDFGQRTIRAVLEFQSTKFGEGADDGIVGPVTASALGIAWPEV